MSTPIDAAREQARQDNGQFGTQSKAEVDVDLAAHQASRVIPTEPQEIPDGDGVGYIVEPGVIDEGSQAVYCSGAQSLALSRQIHDQTGWPVLVTYRTGPDPLLDPEDWDDADQETVLYEAHAVCPAAGLVTINGLEEHYPSGGSEFVDAWEYRRELISNTQVLNGLDDYCEQDPDEDMAATFVEPVLLANGLPWARKPLTAKPSTNPAAAPFGSATTLEALDDHFDALVSPENISWDGERSPGEAQAEQKRLNAAYWERRREIDPDGSRSFCTVCRREVEANANGTPQTHDNPEGRNCWMGQ